MSSNSNNPVNDEERGRPNTGAARSPTKVFRLRNSAEGWYYGGPHNIYPSERGVRHGIKILTGLPYHPVKLEDLMVECFVLAGGSAKSAKEFLSERA
jgi:hypothetical protein